MKLLKPVSCCIVFFAPMAFGAGFQLNELGVAALGRAHAGEPAMTDTAAAMARNPAAMAGFKTPTLSLAYHYIDPDIDVEGTISTPSPFVSANGNARDIAPSASVPGLYYIQPLDEQWAVGVAVNSYFGLSTDYGQSYPGTEFAQETSIKTYYLTPTVSFKPVDSVSLGIGVSYIYGEGVIKNSTTPTINTLASIPDNTVILDLDGDGDAFGYQLGLAWDIDSHSRIGFRYQSAVNLDFDGDMKLFVSPPGAVMPFSGTLTLHLPEVYELGYIVDIGYDVRIMTGVQKTAWSSFDTLTAKIDGVGAVLLKDEDWKDVWRYSVGAEYRASNVVLLRVGLGSDKSPVRAQKRTLTIPDADRNWYSVGANFRIDKASSVDVAFMYIDADSVSVNETSKFGTQFRGKLSSIAVYLYGVQYNYTF